MTYGEEIISSFIINTKEYFIEETETISSDTTCVIQIKVQVWVFYLKNEVSMQKLRCLERSMQIRGAKTTDASIEMF